MRREREVRLATVSLVIVLGSHISHHPPIFRDDFTGIFDNNNALEISLNPQDFLREISWVLGNLLGVRDGFPHT